MSEERCGCCEGIEKMTPQPIANRPGLDALLYRVGTHATFLETMIARLTDLELEVPVEIGASQTRRIRPLKNLTTRSTSDPAIALLDAWATVADVLTFYQERIANEGYLGTATERRSILELARLVGYRLRPGVAASVYLAFTLEKDFRGEVPAGTRAQSVPDPGELPQAFETSEPLVARAEWNALKPRLTRPQHLTSSNTSQSGLSAYFEGTATNLKPNDPILFVFDKQPGQQTLRWIDVIETDSTADRTKTELQAIPQEGRAKEFSAETRRMVKTYVDKAPEGTIAEGVVVDLQALEAALDKSPEEVAQRSLPESTRKFEELYEHCPDTYRVLRPWLGGLISDAKRLVSLVADTGTAARRTAFGEASDPSGDEGFLGNDDPPPVGLDDLIEPLLTPPSLQPANAQRLQRSLKTTFAENADSAPRLLTTFKPVLKDSLYQAWSEAGVTPPSELQSTETLRVKAAPFGHNAPLKPIYDGQGQIVGYEEWPLADPVTTSLRLIISSAEGAMQTVTGAKAPKLAFPAFGATTDKTDMGSYWPSAGLEIKQGAETLRRVLPLAGQRLILDQTIEMGLHSVRLSIGPLVRFAGIPSSYNHYDIYVDDEQISVRWRRTDADIDLTDDVGLLPGGHHFQFALQGEPSSDKMYFDLEEGKAYTIVADGSGTDLSLVRLAHDPWVATGLETQIRAVHLDADSASATSVKAIKDGEEFELITSPLGYGETSNSLRAQVGSYDITFELSDGATVTRESINLAAGRAYDIFLHPGDEGRRVDEVETDDFYNIVPLTADFQDIGHELRLHAPSTFAEPQPVIVQIAANGKTLEWQLVPGQELREKDDGNKVIIDLDPSQGPLISYEALQKLVPDPIVPEPLKTVALEAELSEIRPGTWVVIKRPARLDRSQTETLIRKAVKVRTISKAAYGITGKSTQLTLDADWLSADDKDLSVLRGTSIYAQSEALDLAEEPIEDEVAGSEIELGGLYDGLEDGRWIIVSGERTDVPGTRGVEASELVMIAGITQDVQKVDRGDGTTGDRPDDKTHTTLKLARTGLAYRYKRDTVRIHGNVVKATHGETREEVLGSGDSSQALQTFALKQSPLTYLSAPTAAGAESTLLVRVDAVQWHEKESLLELAADGRGFVTRTDNEDKTSVTFGDGHHGALPPTGSENITATYRNGIGKVGNVARQKISSLATRPLGVKEVVNPLPATGGANREGRDQARRNVPLAVMALDRLVSTQDYADFARTFAGIGKAAAVRLSDGRRQVVHLTIAGDDDIPIDIPNSDLYRNLLQALHKQGDPHQPIQIALRELLLLVIVAKVRLLSDFEWESVEPEIRKALLDTFSFDRRGLGQDVVRSEVISRLQSVEGVAYADLDTFDAVKESVTLDDLTKLSETLELRERISVDTATVTEDDPEHRIRPAQLAYLSPESPFTLILTELSS